MARQIKSRVAKPYAGGEFSEARFWQFLRSGLRQMSRRWPPVTRQVWNESRRPYVGPNKRQKFEHQCSSCLKWFKRADMEADHIVPCGSLKSWDDLIGFTQRLLCEVEGVRRLCNRCHQARTNRKGDEETG